MCIFATGALLEVQLARERVKHTLFWVRGRRGRGASLGQAFLLSVNSKLHETFVWVHFATDALLEVQLAREGVKHA